MNKIIISAFTVLLAFSTLASAEEKVEEFKQQVLQQIDKEFAKLSQIRGKEDGIMGQFKSCIQAVKTEADFKACITAKDESIKKFQLEQQKEYLDAQEKALANAKKRVNDEMKAVPKK